MDENHLIIYVFKKSELYHHTILRKRHKGLRKEVYVLSLDFKVNRRAYLNYGNWITLYIFIAGSTNQTIGVEITIKLKSLTTYHINI